MDTGDNDLTFKNRKFCTDWKTCEHHKYCEAALTPEVEAQAIKWWGTPYPPIDTYLMKPNCHSDNDKGAA